jgi:hypothetical protein
MAVLAEASDDMLRGTPPTTGCSTTEVADSKSEPLSGETVTAAGATNSEVPRTPRNFWFAASQNIVAWLRYSPPGNQRVDGCFDLVGKVELDIIN